MAREISRTKARLLRIGNNVSWSAVRAISSSRVRVCSTLAPKQLDFINEPAGRLANARCELFFGNAEKRSGGNGHRLA